MYQIALCDDETTELHQTEQMLKNYEERHDGAEFAIKCFESADEMLGQVRAGSYVPDLILMDIYMQQGEDYFPHQIEGACARRFWRGGITVSDQTDLGGRVVCRAG